MGQTVPRPTSLPIVTTHTPVYPPNHSPPYRHNHTRSHQPIKHSMAFSAPKPPPKPVKCVRKGCNKCLFCYRISAKCECSSELKATDPPGVMYGWCVKCREKYHQEYGTLCGNNCTYCGGGIEDNSPAAAIA